MCGRYAYHPNIAIYINLLIRHHTWLYQPPDQRYGDVVGTTRAQFQSHKVLTILLILQYEIVTSCDLGSNRSCAHDFQCSSCAFEPSVVLDLHIRPPYALLRVIEHLLHVPPPIPTLTACCSLVQALLHRICNFPPTLCLLVLRYLFHIALEVHPSILERREEQFSDRVIKDAVVVHVRSCDAVEDTWPDFGVYLDVLSGVLRSESNVLAYTSCGL